MRAFIVLCLVALTTADKLGYNYHPYRHDSNTFGRGESNLGGPIGSGGFGGVGGVGGSGSDGFGGLGAGSNQVGSVAGDGGYEKEFYTFSANDGDFDQPEASEQIANSIKRNLQVVFIKGPENKGLENAALNLAKQASEQRTAIYVLNKQSDLGDLANKINAEHNQNRHKPEVHFVKYRTPEDAQAAQSQIQSQYDALGGSSQSHNGGVAPVLDFASKGHNGGVGQSVHGGHIGGGDFVGAQSSRTGTYLPPFRLF